MSKSEVYSWRVSPETREALEVEARREGVTIAALLDRVAAEWLAARGRLLGNDAAEQDRRHAAAAACFGSIAGGAKGRAERARRGVRARLQRRRAG